MSRRSTETGGIKGVTTVRNGVSYSVNLPKFTSPPNASSIKANLDDIHQEFRKLTPKQRIAVLTLRDTNILRKLYLASNDLWFKLMNEMRKSVGQASDDVALIRQFCHSFEYLFGEDLSDGDDSDHEDSKPLLKKSTVSSSTSSVTRPVNTTFSFTSNEDPTVFKAKLSFVTTKDALGVLIDGSTDFLQSGARMRSRILQKPEMWDRIVSGPCESLAAYESMIYQLFEFRVWYEYLSMGAGTSKPFVPFAHIKKQVPNSDDAWTKKEAVLVRMEQGDVQPLKTVKKSKKQLLLAKIKQDLAKPFSAVVQSSASEDETEEEEDEVVVDSEPVRSEDPVVFELEEDIGDEWIQVGKQSSRKSSSVVEQAPPLDKKPFPSAAPSIRSSLRRHLSEIPAVWRPQGAATYTCESAVATLSRTFIHVERSKPIRRKVQECPF